MGMPFRRWGVVLFIPALLHAGDVKPFDLPAPQTEGGKPLMQAIRERKSSRAFSPAALPSQVLSNLLWAAFGVNRPDGHRTAPSAMNRQSIEVYVATQGGLYRYEAGPHRLQGILPEDVRAATGTQDFVRGAAVNLVYVADYARMGNSSAEDKLLYSGVEAGGIAQNVYLYCASEGLATVVRASVDRAALAKVMGLRPEQHIVLAQSVGYPPK
ncbi:MAG: SagB/ThcOx family dehydrogenase [Acidobacteriota bacterium]|nr:SagB/ThcOx family dehydrogenase [Acidobacteriota bacterium]